MKTDREGETATYRESTFILLSIFSPTIELYNFNIPLYGCGRTRGGGAAPQKADKRKEVA